MRVGRIPSAPGRRRFSPAASWEPDSCYFPPASKYIFTDNNLRRGIYKERRGCRVVGSAIKFFFIGALTPVNRPAILRKGPWNVPPRCDDHPCAELSEAHSLLSPGAIWSPPHLCTPTDASLAIVCCVTKLSGQWHQGCQPYAALSYGLSVVESNIILCRKTTTFFSRHYLLPSY